MRGIRVKFSDYQKKVLVALLWTGSQDKENPAKAEACKCILNQIEEKTKAKFYDKNKRKGLSN